ncbi:MAG: PQQ-binding-like beta-propeller repeat protein [Marmoricola sp.]
MTVPCPFGSPGRFRPRLPELTPPVSPRSGFGDELQLVAGPVTASGSLYAADRALGLVCLDATTGAIRWNVETQRGWGECLLDADHVVTTPRPGRLLVLDQRSGAVVSEAYSEVPLLAYSVVVDGQVLGPLVEGDLGAWDLSGQDFAWRVPSTVRVDAPVAVSDGALLTVEKHAVVAYDVADGTLRWRFDVSEAGQRETIVDGLRPGQVATHVVTRDGLTWAGLTGGVVVAIGLDDGEQRWRAALGSVTAPVVDLTPATEGDAGSLVVVADHDLVRLDAATGDVRLREGLDQQRLQSPVVSMALSAAHAWLVDRQGRLTAVALDTGEISDQRETGGFVHQPPLVTDDGVYVTDFEGRLHAFAPDPTATGT